jgi:hypothetical protein
MEKFRVVIDLSYKSGEDPDPSHILDAVQDNIEQLLADMLGENPAECEVCVEIKE